MVILLCPIFFQQISFIKNLLGCFNYLTAHVSVHELQRANCLHYRIYTFPLDFCWLRSQWGWKIVSTLLGFLSLGREIFCLFFVICECGAATGKTGFRLFLSAHDDAFCHFTPSLSKPSSATLYFFFRISKAANDKIHHYSQIWTVSSLVITPAASFLASCSPAAASAASIVMDGRRSLDIQPCVFCVAIYLFLKILGCIFSVAALCYSSRCL